jgi:trimeric autotransporter adhesin
VDKSSETLGLRYSEFVVPLVKAVQEQQAVIEKQQSQIETLLKRIEALEKK